MLFDSSCGAGATSQGSATIFWTTLLQESMSLSWLQPRPHLHVCLCADRRNVKR
jgi:hypothetical protein